MIWDKDNVKMVIWLPMAMFLFMYVRMKMSFFAWNSVFHEELAVMIIQNNSFWRIAIENIKLKYLLQPDNTDHLSLPLNNIHTLLMHHHKTGIIHENKVNPFKPFICMGDTADSFFHWENEKFWNGEYVHELFSGEIYLHIYPWTLHIYMCLVLPLIISFLYTHLLYSRTGPPEIK